MIFGIGIDLADVKRFRKWVLNPEMIERYFNHSEVSQKRNDYTERQLSSLCQHYAVRFAAKEAFSKALGTGITFDLKDVYIIKNQEGKPTLVIENSAKKLLDEKCPNAIVHVSLTHEKEYACAYVIIEKQTKAD